MISSLSSRPRLVRAACGVAVLVSFAACGGASDPGLFSASSSAGMAGNSNLAGAPSDGGASAQGGVSAQAGLSSSGGSVAGEGPTEGGATNGGSGAAGAGVAGNPGVAGAPHAGAGGSTSAVGGGAGAASGGSAGSVENAGSGGNGDETCQSLFAKANRQLAAAQVCSLAMDSLACTSTVRSTCNCEVPVNRPEGPETKAYLATLDELDQKKCAIACPALACAPTSHASCKVSAVGSTTGTCVASYETPLGSR